MAPLHDEVDAQVAKQTLVAFARHHRHHLGEPGVGDRMTGGLCEAAVSSRLLLFHVVDLDLGEDAQSPRDAEHRAGLVGVDVDFQLPVVPDNQQAVPQAAQGLLERGLIEVRAREKETRAISEVALLLRRFLLGQRGHRSREARRYLRLHPTLSVGGPFHQYDQPESAGIDHAGVGQCPKQRGSPFNALPSGGDDVLKKGSHLGGLRRLSGGLRHLPEHGQHGAFNRLANRAVGRLGGMAQSPGKHLPADRTGSWASTSIAPRMIWDRITPLLPRAPISAACEMAEHTSRSGRSSGSLADGIDHALDGERQVGTRVSVGHRVDVQIVDFLFALLERREAGCEHLSGPGYGERAFRVTPQA